ncbi:hypothetical protein SERLA73DRAFT_79781 [Serpula lacrymans var. lacrymans S7.3]|uniref:Uncharacterized protein n=1 Tax=Serpula lacrymans var. lacrymans (strain S7.3) TaxID=936435 RepID=F8QHJ6_SERL3|nr:hypothetical protein SERLA73DRAFT_79781 [Serpula lacrymans var. lacrymans S7.3]
MPLQPAEFSSRSGPLTRELTQATLGTTTPPSTQLRPPRFRRDPTSTPPATQPRPPGLQRDPTSTPPSTQASLRPPRFRGHDDSGSTYRDHEGNLDRQSPVDQIDNQDIEASQVAEAKRRIATLEDELEKLRSGLKRKMKGADGAQGDDAGNLKPIIVSWIAEIFSVTDLTLDASNKSSRGFANNHTGRLLCPIEYDWSGSNDRDPDFLVTALMMPTFLYKNYNMNADNMKEGIQVYLYLPFGSDTRTRNHVAALLGMQSVKPRAIAYVAVQVSQFIVDFPEMPPGPASKNRVNMLLLWWNQKVFGLHNASNYSPQDYARMLMSKLKAQRVARESISSI